MDNQFLEEISACSITDLEFMLNMDSDSYSSEELALIWEVLAQKKDSLRLQKKLSGDVLFCILALLIYLIGNIAGSLSGFSLFGYVGLLFGLIIRLNHFQIGKKIISDKTFYSMMILLYPDLGIILGIYILLKIPRFRRYFLIMVIAVLVRLFLLGGGIQF